MNMIMIKGEPHDGTHQMIQLYIKEILEKEKEHVLIIEDTGEFYPFCHDNEGEIIFLGITEEDIKTNSNSKLLLAECKIPVEYCLRDIYQLAKKVSKDLENICIIYKSHNAEEFDSVMYQWKRIIEEKKDN